MVWGICYDFVIKAKVIVIERIYHGSWFFIKYLKLQTYVLLRKFVMLEVQIMVLIVVKTKIYYEILF